MKIMNWKLQHTFLLVFAFFFIYSFRNAIFFPPRGSFDASSHYQYAEILTTQWRIPVHRESAHFHNPPLWYFIGGLTIKLYKYFFNSNNWKEVIKIWQLINPLITTASLYLWLQIYLTFNSKKYKQSLFFVLFLFSLPIVQKMTAMLSVEPLLLFFTSLSLFILARYYLKTYDYKSLFFLGVASALAILTKITAFSLVITLIILIIYINKIKKLSLNSLAKRLLVMLIPIIVISGPFYAWKQSKYGILKPGGINYQPGKQESSFYFYIPARLMFTYPMRHYLGQTFLPIMYTDFWGDYWNYYSQKRYGIDIEYIRTVDRLKTTPDRIKTLIFQNAVNLPVTVLMTVAFFWACWLNIKAYKKKNYSSQNFFHLSLIILFIISSLGYIWFQSRSPKWTGSNVKPYHLLFIWPTLVYFATQALFNIIQKKPFLKWISLLFLIFTFVYNLSFTCF